MLSSILLENKHKKEFISWLSIAYTCSTEVSGKIYEGGGGKSPRFSYPDDCDGRRWRWVSELSEVDGCDNP